MKLIYEIFYRTLYSVTELQCLKILLYRIVATKVIVKSQLDTSLYVLI